MVNLIILCFCSFFRKSHEKINIGYSRIGSRYKKAIFKAFTDASFTQAIPSPPWAGLLGPVIRAEVGDTVYVHFKNMASGSNFSVHPHGFLYRKNSEGKTFFSCADPESFSEGGGPTLRTFFFLFYFIIYKFFIYFFYLFIYLFIFFFDAWNQIPLKSGHHRPANETPLKWRFAGGPLMTQY